MAFFYAPKKPAKTIIETHYNNFEKINIGDLLQIEKILKRFHFLLVILLLLSFSRRASAQSDNPQLPVYIVQSGNTLIVIALKFNVSVKI